MFIFMFFTNPIWIQRIKFFRCKLKNEFHARLHKIYNGAVICRKVTHSHWSDAAKLKLQIITQSTRNSIVETIKNQSVIFNSSLIDASVLVKAKMPKNCSYNNFSTINKRNSSRLNSKINRVPKIISWDIG